MFRKLAEERKMPLEKFQEMAAADPSIDRLVDERTMLEAESGDVVVDGQLGGWVLKEISDLRILLTAPLVVRLERIAARDRISLEEARRQTLHREAVQAERYRKHYGFSVDDWSIYHLILSSLTTRGAVNKILRSEISFNTHPASCPSTTTSPLSASSMVLSSTKRSMLGSAAAISWNFSSETFLSSASFLNSIPADT